jgi:hypothetical protein
VCHVPCSTVSDAPCEPDSLVATVAGEHERAHDVVKTEGEPPHKRLGCPCSWFRVRVEEPDRRVRSCTQRGVDPVVCADTEAHVAGFDDDLRWYGQPDGCEPLSLDRIVGVVYQYDSFTPCRIDRRCAPPDEVRAVVIHDDNAEHHGLPSSLIRSRAPSTRRPNASLLYSRSQ